MGSGGEQRNGDAWWKFKMGENMKKSDVNKVKIRERKRTRKKVAWRCCIYVALETQRFDANGVHDTRVVSQWER